MSDERALVKEEKGQAEISLATIGARAERTAREVLEVAKARARVVAELIRDRKLYVKIGNREHVECEGWVTLASSYDLVPEIEWTHPLPDNAGWEARAILVDMETGAKRGAGEAECRFAEENWTESESYAVRSMAQTRAVSKVCRLRLSAVMVLAGFAATPAEEMESGKREVVSCRECGVPTVLFRDGKARGHKLADGKWHRQSADWQPAAPPPQAVPEATPAPAAQPAAPAKVVEATPTAQDPEVMPPSAPGPAPRAPTVKPRPASYQNWGDFWNYVWQEKKVTKAEVLKVAGQFDESQFAGYDEARRYVEYILTERAKGKEGKQP